ncbi:PREDICTED: protein FAM221B isoform X2 [Chinchilla lanigera]|uniref:protein FAM221B isoform X2 n=1 Tax=Chinchilla lanigera TaxID=34839 RepID=UPI00038ED09A|nr:PREDICTED: protein FAM221B isoform X2 [Chinchilla lanigera]
MEADETTEEQDTTTIMDAKEHPSSKDPSVEDLQALPTSETPLEPSISQIPLEPLAAETPLESHTSKPPLVPSPSLTTLLPQASESPLKPSIPMTSFEKSISDIPLEAPTPETDMSEVPEKHLIFLPASVNHASVSPSDALRENLLSESSSKEVPWMKGSSHAPEFEHLPEHSLAGPSAHIYTDTSAKQQEEAEEDKNVVGTSDITAHTAQPGHQPRKKKGKKGIIRYTGHSVVPTKQAELVEMAKAMHREQFGAQVNHLFQWEKDAALNAIQTGLYIGWRCPHYLWDCYRIGDESKCFCGHLLKQHQIVSDISVPCTVGQCRCLIFCFIPSRPEEVGEFWLRRRATFNPKAWRAQCRCKHSHEDHAANGAHPCRHHGCSCNCFESNFLCAACDRRWEEHATFFETEETRRRGGRPQGTHAVNSWHRPF